MGFKTDKSNVGGYHHNHRAPIAGMHTPVWSLTWFLHDPVEEVVIVSKTQWDSCDISLTEVPTIEMHVPG